MSHFVKFIASVKAAFRVTIQGKHPNEISSFLLTGDGDTKNLELKQGDYTAGILNIGSGEAYSFLFSVNSDESNEVQYVGRRSNVSSAWRSATRENTVHPSLETAMPSISDLPQGFAAAKLRMRGTDLPKWRSFSGSYLTTSARPEAVKVVRSKNWGNAPIVRCDLANAFGRRWHSFIPLFSTGTLIHVDKIGNGLISISPNDPKSQALVGSLNNSHRGEASQIVEWATGVPMADALRTIQQSREDPWAAVATGLLLIGAGQSKCLGQHSLRLAQRNAWLADASVVAAWWLASQSDEDGCLMQLTRARKAGQIYYWNTFSLAEQLLSALGSNANSTKTQADARKELGRWKRFRSGATNIGAFVAWISEHSIGSASAS